MLNQFQCNGCSVCCQKILVNSGDLCLGLMLLPKEVPFFPEETVSPMWARKVGSKLKPVSYQLNRQPCPHLKENKCGIYESRPAICRAYPVTLTWDKQDNITGLTLSKTCEPARNLIGKTLPIEVFPQNYLKASAQIHSLKAKFGKDMCLFNLKTMSWIKITLETALQVEDAFKRQK